MGVRSPKRILKTLQRRVMIAKVRSKEKKKKRRKIKLAEKTITVVSKDDPRWPFHVYLRTGYEEEENKRNEIKRKEKNGGVEYRFISPFCITINELCPLRGYNVRRCVPKSRLPPFLYPQILIERSAQKDKHRSWFCRDFVSGFAG